MDEHEWLAQQFEANREHLRSVAYRMLGSLSEVDDAVQEAWLRLSRTDTRDVSNLGGWLTTVVSRICLDILRARKARREESIDAPGVNPLATQPATTDPEQEAQLADGVGVALLVVLETLSPAERLAFVLHDMFAVSFEEIAPIVGRTPEAARQLASRARRRVQGRAAVSQPDLTNQRSVVDAFLAALRSNDFDGLVAVLDPNLVIRTDALSPFADGATEVRGAEVAARKVLSAARGARFARPALVNGEVGVVIAPLGKLIRVLHLKFKDGKIAQIDTHADPEYLRQLQLSTLGDG